MVAVPLFSFVYQGNLQERYFHIPNSLLLIATTYGLYLLLGEIKTKMTRARLVPALLLGLMLAASDYWLVYRELECFGNMQTGGVYRRDGGKCDRSAMFFGLVERDRWIRFPRLTYSAYFPNARSGTPVVPFEALDKIKTVMRPGMRLRVLDGGPNYLSEPWLAIMYLEQTGTLALPSDAKGSTLVVSLSFPPASPYNSIIYSAYEQQSSEKALNAWKKALSESPHEILLEEKNEWLNLLVARVESS